jgi:hypothetical protein
MSPHFAGRTGSNVAGFIQEFADSSGRCGHSRVSLLVYTLLRGLLRRSSRGDISCVGGGEEGATTGEFVEG